MVRPLTLSSLGTFLDNTVVKRKKKRVFSLAFSSCSITVYGDSPGQSVTKVRCRAGYQYLIKKRLF